MKPEDFEALSAFLKQRSGLVLTPEKGYLLESRLQPVARQFRLRDLSELTAAVRARRDEALNRAVVEAMTTNESLFFRDQKPFELFRAHMLPYFARARAGRPVRVWSAASSSGQEPYSLAMAVDEEAPKHPGLRVEIIATDLSIEMVERARAGLYSQFEVQRGLPIASLVKHFTQQGDKWLIAEKLRRMVQFRQFNLLDDPAPLGQFDIVFCRNVLIYFDQETKAKVLRAIARIMPADGMLCLGGAETVIGITDAFRPVDGQRGLYSPAR